MTPDTEDMIDMCFVPQVESYHVMEGNTSECRRNFDVYKYYTQEYICYGFRMKLSINTTFTYHNLAFSLAYPGLFYGILINTSKIHGADSCKIAVHEKNTPPYGLLGYAPVFTRKANDVEAYNFIKVGYTVTEIDLMPPPFDTGCRWYSKSDFLRSYCVDMCLNNSTLVHFGKVPFTSLQSKPTPLKHVNNVDVMNTTTSQLLDKLEHACDDECFQPACETEHYSTRLQKEEKSELDFFTILLQAPTLPNINVTSYQKVLLSDFLIYVTSCVGTWFGASALTFSPMSLRHLAVRQQKRCHCLFCHRNRQRLCRQILRMRIFIRTFSPT